MIPESVTLIVKAPNQQIEDQNIECQSSWTVGQLKGHLSMVYPSQPRTDEQKIIYSGQLLDDNTVLKDVLRTYDSQIAHTMHLVCTPKRIMTEQTQAPESNTDGLRHRTVPEPERERIPEVTRPETRQNDQNHTVEMQNYLNSFANNYGRVPPYPNYNMGEGYLPVPNDPAMLANHMIMMQQAYMQYMQQYANMWQATNAAPAPTPEVPQPPQEPPPAADDEEANRDWLDHLYAASRLAILLSLVYLYGSPARFLLILLLAAAGYLHQIGFFRDLQLNQAANQANRVNQAPNPANQANRVNQAPNPANQPGNQINQPDNQMNQQGNQMNQPGNQMNQPANQMNQPGNQMNQPGNQMNQPNQAGNPEDQSHEQPGNQNQAEGTPNNDAVATDNQQSLLAVTWMIFTSFFASLIPDTNV